MTRKVRETLTVYLTSGKNSTLSESLCPQHYAEYGMAYPVTKHINGYLHLTLARFWSRRKWKLPKTGVACTIVCGNIGSC